MSGMRIFTAWSEVVLAPVSILAKQEKGVFPTCIQAVSPIIIFSSFV